VHPGFSVLTQPSFICIEDSAQNCYGVLMALLTSQEARPEYRRRSQRVRARIPVVVRTQADKNTPPEKTEALVVNAHGALVLLAMPVSIDQFVIVQNPKTGEELLSRVSTVGDSFMGKTQVGIEFIKPAPRFWGITSPPEDWKGRPLNRRKQ
jgi:hypothetical protein